MYSLSMNQPVPLVGINCWGWGNQYLFPENQNYFLGYRCSLFFFSSFYDIQFHTSTKVGGGEQSICMYPSPRFINCQVMAHMMYHFVYCTCVFKDGCLFFAHFWVFVFLLLICRNYLHVLNTRFFCSYLITYACWK